MRRRRLLPLPGDDGSEIIERAFGPLFPGRPIPADPAGDAAPQTSAGEVTRAPSAGDVVAA